MAQSLLAHREAVRIERSKIAPKTKLGRGGKAVQVVGRQKQDVVTRFTNAKGEELGRLPEETAKWVSALLDQRICRFEGSCVYAPERVRTNETVYLQLRAYMLKPAFESSAFVKPEDDNRVTGIFEEKESIEEKDLRLRQVALVKLFDEVNLHPTTTNDTTAKHKKQGLLRAAEMAEQYDKDTQQSQKPMEPQHRSLKRRKKVKSSKKISLMLFTRRHNRLISTLLKLTQQKISYST